MRQDNNLIWVIEDSKGTTVGKVNLVQGTQAVVEYNYISGSSIRTKKRTIDSQSCKTLDLNMWLSQNVFQPQYLSKDSIVRIECYDGEVVYGMVSSFRNETLYLKTDYFVGKYRAVELDFIAQLREFKP